MSVDITVNLEVATPEVANTRAGLLVRAPNGKVAAYYHEVSAAERPTVSSIRTAFINISTQLRLDGRAFVPAKPPILIAKVFDMVLFNTSLELPIPTDPKAWTGSYKEMSRSQQEIEGLRGVFLEKSPYTRFMSSLGTGMSGIALLILIMTIIICACWAHGDKCTKYFGKCGCPPPQPPINGEDYIRKDE